MAAASRLLPGRIDHALLYLCACGPYVRKHTFGFNPDFDNRGYWNGP